MMPAQRPKDFPELSGDRDGDLPAAFARFPDLTAVPIHFGPFEKTFTEAKAGVEGESKKFSEVIAGCGVEPFGFVTNQFTNPFCRFGEPMLAPLRLMINERPTPSRE
jgi:hypothetical protein